MSLTPKSRSNSMLLLGLESLRPDERVAALLHQEVAGVEILGSALAQGPPPRAWRAAWGSALEAEGIHQTEVLVAADWQVAGTLCREPAPEPGFLGWELAEGGQPLEVLLAALAFGKELAAASVNLLFGPSLALSSDLKVSFGPRPGLVGKAASVFVEGLATAGVQSCVGRFQDSYLDESGVLDDGLAFGLLANRGVAAIEGELASTVPTGLRETLAYEGVIATPMIHPEAGVDPIDLVVGALEQGFDLVRLAGIEAQGRVVEGLGRELERRALVDRSHRAAERVSVLRSRI